MQTPTIPRYRLDGMRRHKLLTADIARKLPGLGDTDSDGPRAGDATVVAKFFSPYSGHTWYVTEGEERDGEWTFYGLVVTAAAAELGYFALSELAEAGSRGLPLVERDKFFRPQTLAELVDNSSESIPMMFRFDLRSAFGAFEDDEVSA